MEQLDGQLKNIWEQGKTPSVKPACFSMFCVNKGYLHNLFSS